MESDKQMLARRTFILILLVASAVTFLAAGETTKTIQAVRVEQAPEIDGSLLEPAWQTAHPVLDFTQYDPNEGAPPTELTSVRILYDDRALYIGAICYDSHPELIVRQLSRRDRSTEADRFALMLDSYADRQSAFFFSVNVSGVQSDGIMTQAGMFYDNTWDEVWQVETQVYLDGWSAEFRIPFNAIRFATDSSAAMTWGINFRRVIARKRETVEWVMVPRSEQLQIPFWGTLTGLTAIDPSMHLDIVPYVSGSLLQWSPSSGHASTSETDALAGVDVKYGVSRNYTLDATINPDFGQVEVDQAVLNLTVFETLYPEKRPFFVEGAQFFTFGSSFDNTPMSLFFSRRIGRQPTGSFTVPPGGLIVENPSVTTILGAAKLSGRSATGLAVGALAALTDREFVTVRDVTGAEIRTETEPRASYNAVRVRQDYSDGTWFGGMATLTGKEGLQGGLSGGVDWSYRFGDNLHALEGYLAGTRPSTGLTTGTAGRLLVSRISAEHWLYAGSYSFASRAFDPNDIGFFARPHDQGGYTQLVYRENYATGIARRYAISVVPEARWNWNGVRTLAQIEVAPTMELQNFWRVGLTATGNLPAYDDAERGVLGLYRRPTGIVAGLSVVSDQQKDVSGSLTAGYETDVLNMREYLGLLALSIRPAAWLELKPSMYYQNIRGEETGAFTGGAIATITDSTGTYSVFGDRDLDQVSLDLRGILTFTRTLSLQMYLQALAARAYYVNYRALTGPETFVPVPVAAGTYDFNSVYFNANVLLRWEYLPGSTIYFVWTQSRFDAISDAVPSLGDRLGDIPSIPHDDVFLLKISYWFSP
jgi:hypothetical protein